MRIYELLHALVDKFVPMDEVTKSQLRNDAMSFYSKVVDEKLRIEGQIKEALQWNNNEELKKEKDFKPMSVPTLSLKHKVTGMFEQWYMRYLFAILFVVLVPKIKDFMNGEKDEPDDDDGDSEFEQYMNFKRMQKMNR